MSFAFVTYIGIFPSTLFTDLMLVLLSAIESLIYVIKS